MAVTQTTRRILDAAEARFFTDGIAVTGVDTIAAEAGVAIATLYKHVGSKDGLLEAVLTRRLQSWSAHWEDAIGAASSPADRLLAVFDAITTYRESAGEVQWCCFLATASERPPAAAGSSGAQADGVRDLLDQDTQLLTDRLRTLAWQADLIDPGGVVDQLLLVYNGALSSLLRGSPSASLVVARQVAETVVQAAGRRPRA